MPFSSQAHLNKQKEQMYLLCPLPYLKLISFWIIAMHLWIFAPFMSHTHAATPKAK